MKTMNNFKTRPEAFRFTDKYFRENNETRIYNLIILDESGSMDSIREQAFSGANETLQTIRAAQQENPDDHQMISFVTFDSAGGRRPDVRTIIDMEKIENVKDLTRDQYEPFGGTPLYDAMGLSITALREHVKEGDHVLVTVITDGYENSSCHYTAAMIKELVDALTAQGWVFTYIGANQDSERVAGGLGIRSTMDFRATVEGSVIMFDKMRHSNREYYKKVRREKSGEQVDYQEDFYAEKLSYMRITPEHVSQLRNGQIFVFGSNEAGHHDGAAARLARERFGAVYGQGRGLQGRSYAIPTMNLSLDQIAKEVEVFTAFADQHPELTFLVTRIGCGVAGFNARQIAPLFAGASCLPNVHLPQEFWDILNYRYNL